MSKNPNFIASLVSLNETMNVRTIESFTVQEL